MQQESSTFESSTSWTMAELLTFRQRWQLAFRLLVLYLPILLFISVPARMESITFVNLYHELPVMVWYSLVSFCLYFVWIGAMDWIQLRLFKRFGTDFFMKTNGATLILTFLTALVLAILFMYALDFILYIVKYVRVALFHAPIHRIYNPAFTPDEREFNRRLNFGFSLIIMLTSFYLTLSQRAYRRLKNVELKAEKFEKEMALAQFEALKNQISPHFLFNSLNILVSLVHENENLSEQFIKKLSKAYRYILEQKEQMLVNLNTELEFIESYTFLLKIRFENKFEVQIEVPGEIQNWYRIAPLTLQMLVENAVKHNRMSIEEPLLIKIYSNEKFLIIENPLQAREEAPPSTGMGLQNIINRYSFLTELKVEYGARQDCFIVSIPLVK